MKQDITSPKFIRQRKFFTVLPLLTLPFVTLLFWALGGGKVEQTKAAAQGFNFNLPDAYLAEEKNPLDKLGFYEKAEKDSLRLAEMMRNDPYYKHGVDSGRQADSSKLLGLTTNTSQTSGGLIATPYSNTAIDPNEAKVYQKLDQLTSTLNASTQVPQDKQEMEFAAPGNNISNADNNPDMERLETLMRGMQDGSSSQDLRGGDPEMKELSGMLEKILDIQHPERVQERLRQTSEQNKGQVFAVLQAAEDTPITSLSDHGNSSGPTVRLEAGTQNGFFSLDDEATQTPNQNAIEAVVHQTQEIVSGATVKLRLTNDIFINGILIPKDNFIYGLASLDGERLRIEVTNIRYQNSLYPVNLIVFDLDGLNGIHIPGAISRDAAKQSGDRAIQSIGMTTFDQGLGAQAASAGIELGRNLLSKKVRLIKVTVKAGYQVLLRDEKQVAGR